MTGVRFDGVASVPHDWPRSVVTIGVFDGVHIGHRAILATARNRADELGVPVVAVTFDPHPSEVVRPGSHPTLLSTLDQRVELLHSVGADAVVVLPFTSRLAATTPEEFARLVLVERLHATVVVVGENFRFGHRAAGTVETLHELGGQYGFVVDPVLLVGGPGPDRWSSSYLRQCVGEGDVEEAARGLLRPHRVEGIVEHGDHRGRDLGFPTANLDLAEHAAVPGDGVYAGWLVDEPRQNQGRGRARYPAAISIGTNPTFDGSQRRVEAYVLDRTDLDLYEHLVAVEFVARLRETLRFDSVDDLVAQMDRDVMAARDVLAVST